jgi:hypothetical protein
MEPRGAAANALLDLSEQTIDGPAVRPEELLNRRPQSAASERSAASEIPPSPVEPPAPPPPGPPSSAIDGEAALLAKLPRGEASVLSQVAPHLGLFAALALASACVALRGSALAALRELREATVLVGGVPVVRLHALAAVLDARLPRLRVLHVRGAPPPAGDGGRARLNLQRLRRAAAAEIELDLAPTLQSRHASPDVVAALSAVAARVLAARGSKVRRVRLSRQLLGSVLRLWPKHAEVIDGRFEAHQLGDPGASLVASLLRNAPPSARLVRLDLSQNLLTDWGLLVLSHSLLRRRAPELRELTLSFNNIGGDDASERDNAPGLRALGTALSLGSGGGFASLANSLETLSLSHNELGDDVSCWSRRQSPTATPTRTPTAAAATATMARRRA